MSRGLGARRAQMVQSAEAGVASAKGGGEGRTECGSHFERGPLRSQERRSLHGGGSGRHESDRRRQRDRRGGQHVDGERDGHSDDPGRELASWACGLVAGRVCGRRRREGEGGGVVVGVHRRGAWGVREVKHRLFHRRGLGDHGRVVVDRREGAARGGLAPRGGAVGHVVVDRELAGGEEGHGVEVGWYTSSFGAKSAEVLWDLIFFPTVLSAHRILPVTTPEPQSKVNF